MICQVKIRKSCFILAFLSVGKFLVSKGSKVRGKGINKRDLRAFYKLEGEGNGNNDGTAVRALVSRVVTAVEISLAETEVHKADRLPEGRPNN